MTQPRGVRVSIPTIGVSGTYWTPALTTQALVQTGNYAANPNQIVPVSTANGNVTVTLPNAPAAGTIVVVKMVTQAGSNTVTVSTQSADVFNKINGGTSLSLSLLDQGVLLQYSGGIWMVLSGDLPLSQLDSRYLHAAGAIPNGILAQSLASSVPAIGGAAFICGHRAGGSAQGTGNNYEGPYPEEFIEGYRAAVAAGVKCLNIHVRMLADGGLVCMHDATPDRTTSATGSINVASYTTPAWRQLTGTPQSWPGYGVNWGTIYPPFLEQVLDEFGGRVLLIIEADSAGTTAQPLGSCGTAVADALVAHGLQECAIVLAFSQQELAPAAAAGIQTMYDPPVYGSTGYLPSAILTAMSGGWAAGTPKHVGINVFASTQANITAYLPTLTAAGLTPWAWTLTRRSDMAWVEAAGCNLFFSDEPVYMAATAPVNTSGQDPTVIPAGGTWPHGLLVPYNIGYDRGKLTSNGIQLDYVNPSGSLQIYDCYGSLCPIANAAGTYTITTTIHWDTADSDSTRWAALFICAPDDTVTSANTGNYVNGYNVIFRQNGQLGVYKYSSSGTESQVGSTQTTQSISASQNVVLAIQVTPTAIVITPTVNSTGYGPFTFTDSTYRGGYFHIGKAHSGTAPKLVVSFGTTTAA
jgi:glycerophosphoryl diester phosphodiesterase